MLVSAHHILDAILGPNTTKVIVIDRIACYKFHHLAGILGRHMPTGRLLFKAMVRPKSNEKVSKMTENVQRIVLNVHKYFTWEQTRRRPMSPYNKILKCVSLAVGISEKSMRKILQDKEKNVGI